MTKKTKTKKTSKKPFILVAEDEDFLYKVMKDKLEKEGFEVGIAKDGVEAIDLIKKKKPDLVLLDLVMPRKGGFEVLKEMRASTATKHIPVIILSNLGQNSDIEKAKEYCITEYVIKSNISLKEVVGKIRKVIP